MTLAINLRRLTTSQLFRNSGWMLVGQGLRVVVQGLYFMLIARSLGVTQYGTFVGATALVAVLAPFATWGAGNVLIKNVARAPDTFGHYWGAALHAMGVSAVCLSALALLASKLILPASIPLVLVFEIVLADLFFARLVDMSGQAFQAFQRLSRTATMQFLIALVRLVGAAILLAMGAKASAETWGILYLGASVLSAVVAVLWVNRELGRPRWGAHLSRAEVAQGLHFSIINSASSIYNDIDKTMLARLATLDAAGFYAAAYRILDVAFVPIRSILFAAYSRFFVAGAQGVRAAAHLARKLLPFGIGYSLLAGIALFVLSPIVPQLLGDEYAQSVSVLRLLSVLPFLRTLHYFAADALTGADHQALRSVIQAGIAVANVFLNLWLIPRYSWHGAVWSTLISDGALAVLLWALLGFLALRAPVELPFSVRAVNDAA